MLERCAHDFCFRIPADRRKVEPLFARPMGELIIRAGILLLYCFFLLVNGSQRLSHKHFEPLVMNNSDLFKKHGSRLGPSLACGVLQVSASNCRRIPREWWWWWWWRWGGQGQPSKAHLLPETPAPQASVHGLDNKFVRFSNRMEAREKLNSHSRGQQPRWKSRSQCPAPFLQCGSSTLLTAR